MKILLILLISYSFGLADLIQVYRDKGLKAVQQELNNIMKTKSYWDKYLANKDVRYGYYESVNSILIGNKKQKTLTLYKKINDKFISNFSANIFVGEKNGDKQKEGDLKTPIGVYRLTKRLTKLDPFYGPMALVTSYPNMYDRIQKKTGSGIWIHGLPFNQKRDDFTQGCVALGNKKIKLLNSKIDYKKSIFLLSENDFQITSKDDISNILSQIYSWKDAWEQNDINKYLSYYNDDFKQEKNGNFQKFSKRKIRIFNKNETKTIKLKNIDISPYANNENKLLFKVLMDEDYKAKYYKFNGKKELYIRLQPNGEISILAEG